MTPPDHYGSDADNAKCTEACGIDWNEPMTTCENHRPDIPDDRCDEREDCYRCIGLDALRRTRKS